MFELTKKVVTSVREIPHAPVKSTALGVRDKPEGRPLPEPTSSLEGFGEYLKRASVIGYEPDPLSIVYERVKIVIAQNNILVYDAKAVDEWMLKMVQKERRDMKWVWKSLTQPIDRLPGVKNYKWWINFQHSCYDDKRRCWLGRINTEQQYTKIIPEAVLTTAETILKHFNPVKDPVCLLVSDYEVVLPDPFLAVAVPKHPFLIVDFWNEPGFQPQAAVIDTQKASMNDGLSFTSAPAFLASAFFILRN